MVRADSLRRVLSRFFLPALLLMLPLEFSRLASPIPAVDAGRVVILLGFGLFAGATVLDRKTVRIPQHGSLFLLVALIVYAVVSGLATGRRSAVPATGMLVVYLALTILVFNVAADRSVHDRAWIAMLVSAAVLGLTGLVLYVSGQAIWRPDVVSGLRRVNATFADPDIYVRFLAMGVATGIILFAHWRSRRAAWLAAGAAVLCLAAVPATFSRFGYVLAISAIALAVLAVRTRRAALLALVLLAVLASGVLFDTSAKARLASLLGTTIQSALQPTAPPPVPWASPDLVTRAHPTAAAGGWTLAGAPGDRSIHLAPASAAAGSAVFGSPFRLGSSSYDIWIRAKVGDAANTTPVIRAGLYDLDAASYVPAGFGDLSANRLGRAYGWARVGRVSAAGSDRLQLRVQLVGPPGSPWDLSDMAVAVAKGEATPVPWGQETPAGRGHPTAVSGGWELSGPLVDQAVHLAPGSGQGGSAAFGPPVSLGAGTYNVWLRARVGDDTNTAPVVRAGLFSSAAGGYLAGGYADLSAHDFGRTYGWALVARITTPGDGQLQLRAQELAAPASAWDLSEMAVVAPAAPPMKTAPAPGRPWWVAALDRIPLDDQRRYLIVGGIQMFLDHPVFGVGYDGYQRNLLGPYRSFIRPTFHDSLSHTSLVTIAAELGSIGLLLFALFLVSLGRAVRRALRGAGEDRVYLLAPTVLLLLILLGSQTEGRLLSEPYLWVWLGLLYAAAARLEPAATSSQPGKGRQVLFLTHYFPPEVGAPQTRLYELAVRLARAGDHVTVVAPLPNYPTGVVEPPYRGRLLMEEVREGIRIIRTWVYATPNRGFIKRLANQVSFALSSLLAAGRVGGVDVILVESPPLFLGLSGFAYHLLKQRPYLFNVSDIWPESAVTLGALRNPLLIRLAEALEMFIYRHAARVLVVTRGIQQRLAARGVPAGRLFLLTNGVDIEFYRPEVDGDNPLAQLPLQGKKVFLYAGTHGMAQGLRVVLDAALQTTSPEVAYLLVGEGADKEELVKRAAAEGIVNVHFLPNQPKAAMPGLLNHAYATLIPLRRLDLFKAALPSKMFEAMATGRPIVLAVWGEAAELVEEAGCGLVVEPEDAGAIARAVERLAADPDLAARLGASGRRYVVAHFARDSLAARFDEMLDEVLKP